MSCRNFLVWSPLNHKQDVFRFYRKVRQPRHLVNSWLNEKPFSWRLLPPSAFVNPPEQIRMQLGTKALYQVHHTVTGVDKGGMSDFLRGRNRVLNADPSFDPLQVRSRNAKVFKLTDLLAEDFSLCLQLQEFRPRWENCMRTLLDDLTGQLVRSIEPGAREVASSKVLDQVFVCELCLNRPDEPEAPDRTVAPTYGFVCTTLGTVAEHLRSDEHRRAEMTIRYTRSPQLERVLMLLNRWLVQLTKSEDFCAYQSFWVGDLANDKMDGCFLFKRNFLRLWFLHWTFSYCYPKCLWIINIFHFLNFVKSISTTLL